MIYEVHIPPPPLSQFIESFVYYRDHNPVHSIERFLPDGNIQLVIDLTDSPKVIYDNHSLKEIQSCRNVWFSGIRNHYITIPSGRDSEMFIVNFQKGKAYPFVDMPMNELADCVVDGELVMSKEILNMREALLALTSPVQKFNYAERYLLREFASNFSLNPCIDYSIKEILQSPQHLSLNRLSDKVGFSQKHFIKIFKEHVGVTPKSFIRLMRFQKAIHAIEAGRRLNWAAVAHETGYYDQAHFIGDFKDFSGFTPSQYLTMESTFTNYVAVG